MTIDINDSILDIVTKCPEATEALKDLGFDKIVNPVMLKTMGKIMTLPKASAAKGIPMENIIEAFRNREITITVSEETKQVEGI
ncbi:DUF1858 domain-containing protein [Proteiniclasticum sp.]|uniref:DUF1858 domain-containing protein n=1 Tax=Proteiniclasticum sp. TaxID=2053595 RepID=UPI00289F0BA5|nr:DUF1858 domain-containing protein [Proteiniclasticum sp.]